MPTYIVLANFTQQGIENVKVSPTRLDAVKLAAQRTGGEIKAFYLTMGRHDVVLIVEATTEENLAKVILATAAQGNVRTETLRAFTEDEYRKIISELP